MTIKREVTNIGLVIDTGANNKEFFENILESQDAQKQKWQRACRLFPELAEIDFTVRLHGAYHDFGTSNGFNGLLDVFDKLKFAHSTPSEITNCLNQIHSENFEKGRDPSLIIIVGNKVDPVIDSEENLESIGQQSNIPFLSLFTEENAQSTKNLSGPEIKDQMRILSNASGVKGAPVEVNNDFVDHLIISAMARIGRFEELNRTTLLDKSSLDAYPKSTIRTINAPEKDKNEKKIGIIPFLLGGLAGAAMCWGLHNWLKDDCIKPNVTVYDAPYGVPSITDELDSGTTLQFNNSAVAFEKDSNEIPLQFYPALNEIGQYLQDNPGEISTLFINGHTSTEGPDEYNQSLSEQRALAIKDYLISNFNFDENILEIQGYGEEQPIHSPDPLEFQKEENRRVEFIPVLAQ